MFEAKSYLHDKQQSISQNKHQCLGLGRNSAGEKKKAARGNGYQIKDENWEARGIDLLHRMSPVYTFKPKKKLERGFVLLFIEKFNISCHISKQKMSWSSVITATMDG